MKPQKKPSYEELEEERIYWKSLSIGLMLIFALISLLFLFAVAKITHQRQDLTQCQADLDDFKFDTWVIEVNCPNISGIFSYDSYEKYQNALNSFPENCEVTK